MSIRTISVVLVWSVLGLMNLVLMLAVLPPFEEQRFKSKRSKIVALLSILLGGPSVWVIVAFLMWYTQMRKWMDNE